MSLVTRCPKCQSDFLVSLEQLRVHDGLVRCGGCTNIFDARTTLESQLPTLTQRAAQSPTITSSATSASNASNASSASSASSTPNRSITPSASSAPSTPVAPVVVASHVATTAMPRVVSQSSVTPSAVSQRAEGAPSVLRRRAQTGATASGPEVSEPPAFSASAAEPFYQDPAFDAAPPLRVRGEARVRDQAATLVGRRPPDFMIDETPLDGLRRVLWGGMIAVVGVLLLAQLAFVYRNELVTRVPALMPLLRTACVTLRCEVSFVRHLERITIEGTALEQALGGQIEGRPNVLTLKFSLRNRYDKLQPWPHLSLELKDASGTPVVRKVLAPSDYLPEALLKRPFEAKQEIHLSLPITVSGLQISGVQLERFFP